MGWQGSAQLGCGTSQPWRAANHLTDTIGAVARNRLERVGTRVGIELGRAHECGGIVIAVGIVLLLVAIRRRRNSDR
jgi:hypothetical protein